MSPNAAAVTAVTALLTLMTTIVLGLRLRLRTRTGRGVGKDDWVALIACTLVWCFATLIFIGVGVKILGHHTPTDPITGEGLNITQKRKATKIVWAGRLLMPITFGTIKLSVLFLYQRLFLGKIFRIYSTALIVVIVSWSLAFFFAFAFQCGTHPEYWWTSLEMIRKFCNNDAQSDLAFAVSDVVMDLMVIATPVPIILRLQMGLMDKVGLYLIFGMGALSTAAAVVRLQQIIVNDWLTKLGYRDLLAIDTKDLLWGFIEASVGVIAACLSTLKPLIHGRSADSILQSFRSVLSLRSGSGMSRHGAEPHEEEKLEPRDGANR